MILAWVQYEIDPGQETIPCVIKLLPLFKIQGKYVVCEYLNLKILQGHPHIIPLRDHFLLGPDSNQPQTSEYLALVMDEAPYNLEEFLRIARHRLTGDTMKLIIYQLVVAVHYMHMKGIAHRDIKPSNVLVTKIYYSDDNNSITRVELKLSDYGYSKAMYPKCSIAKSRLGTIWYIPPELIQYTLEQYDAFKGDIWSLGITLFHVVMGYLPFGDEGLRRQEIESRIIWEDLCRNNEQALCRLDPELRVVLECMLHKEPQYRSNMEQLLQLSWFNCSEFVAFQNEVIQKTVVSASSQRLWQNYQDEDRNLQDVVQSIIGEHTN
eukprot:TRINITY_DN2989_c0_g3_i1.p1 TRINITY_DN2989_c0_g3~~TRINITY_DN2989_c0_g3_i1.p1  ORF type:complete len:322 (+),score=12.96 TRINITY_DN2989_c0_g3_i1:509-1474(+)